MEIKKEIINWLLEGDVSVRWHTMNSLLDTSGDDKNYLQKKLLQKVGEPDYCLTRILKGCGEMVYILRNGSLPPTQCLLLNF